jgi:hypothetical protein
MWYPCISGKRKYHYKGGKAMGWRAWENTPCQDYYEDEYEFGCENPNCEQAFWEVTAQGGQELSEVSSTCPTCGTVATAERNISADRFWESEGFYWKPRKA